MRNFVVIALLAVVFLACTAEAKVKLDKIQAAAGIDLAAAVRARAHAETEMVHAEATKTGMLYFNAPSIPKDANFFHPGVKYYRGRINAHEGSRSYTYNPDAGKSFVQLDNKAETIEQGTTFSACANVQVNWGPLMINGAVLGSVDIREEVGSELLTVTLTGKISLGLGFNIVFGSVGGFIEGSLESTFIFPNKQYKNSPSWLIVQSLRALVLDAYGQQVDANDQSELIKITNRMSNIREQLFPVKELDGDYSSVKAIEIWRLVLYSLKNVNRRFARELCDSIHNDDNIKPYFEQKSYKFNDSKVKQAPGLQKYVTQAVLKAWKFAFLAGWSPKISLGVLSSINPFAAPAKFDENAFLTQNPDCWAIMTAYDKQLAEYNAKNKDVKQSVDERWKYAARAMICYYFVYAGPSSGNVAGETPYLGGLAGQGGSVTNLDDSIGIVFNNFIPKTVDGLQTVYRDCKYWASGEETLKKARVSDPLFANVNKEFQKILFPEQHALIVKAMTQVGAIGGINKSVTFMAANKAKDPITKAKVVAAAKGVITQAKVVAAMTKAKDPIKAEDPQAKDQAINQELLGFQAIIVDKFKLTGRLGFSYNLLSSTGLSNRNMCDDNELLTITPFAYEYSKDGYDPKTPDKLRPWIYQGSRVMYDVIAPAKIFSLNIVDSVDVEPGLVTRPFWDRYPSLSLDLKFPKITSVRMSSETPVGAMPPFISNIVAEHGTPAELAAYAPSMEASINNFVATLMTGIPCGLPSESIGESLLAKLADMFVQTAAGTTPLVDDLVLALTPFFSSATTADAENKKNMFTEMRKLFQSALAQAFYAGVVAALSVVANALVASMKVSAAKKMAFELELVGVRGLMNYCPPKEYNPNDPEKKKLWTKPTIHFIVKSFTEVKAEFSVPSTLTGPTGISVQGDLNISSGTDVAFKP